MKIKFRKTLQCTFKIVILVTSGLIVIVLLYPYFLNYLQRTLFSKKIYCSKQNHPGIIILQIYEKVKSKNWENTEKKNQRDQRCKTATIRKQRTDTRLALRPPYSSAPRGPGQRKSLFSVARSPRRELRSTLAMAMGGGGGGGGVPEQEDSVLFRRGTGQVRSRPAAPPDARPVRAPSAHFPTPRSFPGHGAGSSSPFTAGLWSLWFYVFPDLVALAASSFLAQLGCLMALSRGPTTTWSYIGLYTLTGERGWGAGQVEAGKSDVYWNDLHLKRGVSKGE